jgi:DNA invertase Pin-like site-specific DNA recombinase
MYSDNMNDRNSRNRQSKGEKHYAAKLTEDQVAEVKTLFADGWAQATIAARFGISRSHVSNICTGRKWR